MLSFIPIFFVRARESNQTIFLHIHLPTVSVQWCPASPPPPTSNYPTMSSNAPSKCPPMSSYAPLQLSTTGVPGSYRRRHRLTLLPSWRGFLQDIYVLYIYMSQLDYRRISPRTAHTTIPHTSQMTKEAFNRAPLPSRSTKTAYSKHSGYNWVRSLLYQKCCNPN